MALRCRMYSDCLRHLRVIGEKEKVIKRQADRIRCLEKRLKKWGRSSEEEPFGLSTPSSKILLKPTAGKVNQDRKGGRKKGHKGQTRRNFGPNEVDRVARPPLEQSACPEYSTFKTFS